jgi:hypothetical protein
MSAPDTKTPVFAALGFVVVGLIIAAIGGISDGSIAGGIIAGLGIIPACWGMWAGIQQKTQAGMLAPIGLFFLCLGVGAILIILRFVDWLT